MHGGVRCLWSNKASRANTSVPCREVVGEHRKENMLVPDGDNLYIPV